MFSGIIEKNIKAVNFEKSKNSLKAYFKIPREWNIELGESISVDGVCSTVEGIKNGIFSVYYMPETLSKTTMGTVDSSHVFNLERCLTLQTLIGGHLVSGHVDTTASVKKIESVQDSKLITFKISPTFTKYIIYKGSIAVNGVSLTVVTVEKNAFSVSLIPYTLQNTNLGSLKEGDSVNIEVDLVAKYLEKLYAGQA